MFKFSNYPTKETQVHPETVKSWLD